ncbi:hypothetical protein ES705_46900 [subsurface metagenome]
MNHKRRGFNFYFFSTGNRTGKTGIVFFKKSIDDDLSGDFTDSLPSTPGKVFNRQIAGIFSCLN